jgi:hypothetical protein
VDRYQGNRDEPKSVPIDIEAEQRELEAAGWERIETAAGKILWRNPESGYLYPQGTAITQNRRSVGLEDTPERPGEGIT